MMTLTTDGGPDVPVLGCLPSTAEDLRDVDAKLPGGLPAARVQRSWLMNSGTSRSPEPWAGKADLTARPA